MSNHGYHYCLGNTIWSGSGFSTREKAQEKFQELIDECISEKLPRPPRWWEFWKEDVERPCINKHVF